MAKYFNLQISNRNKPVEVETVKMSQKGQKDL